jgi:hypothetical protein
MEQDAAGSPQGPTNPGISRYLASRLPYLTSSSEGRRWRRRHLLTRPPTTRERVPVGRASGRIGGMSRDESGAALTAGEPARIIQVIAGSATGGPSW